MTETCDILIIGAGMAGASLAAQLTGQAEVILIEREEHPGYHSTSRSAAMYVPGYGPPLVRALTAAGKQFFDSAHDEGFCDQPLLTPRSVLMFALPGDEQVLNEEMDGQTAHIPLDQGASLVPPLQTDRLGAIAFDKNAMDLDADRLHQGYLRQFRQNGGKLLLNAEMTGISRKAGTWTVTTGAATIRAPVIVNAAGAWAGTIAQAAQLPGITMTPKRRSAALISPPPDWDIASWPMVYGAGEILYFRPMAGKLMISPADHTDVDPHDAWADDLELARAMDLFGQLMNFEVTHVEHTWAGLRTFSDDGELVIGFDPRADGFFWLAGQGGYGIQTAPAVSTLAAHLIEHGSMPAHLAGFGISEQALSPARLL